MEFVLYIIIFVLIFILSCALYALKNGNLNNKDLSQTGDLDMINELMKRGILSASPDGNGLKISSEVLREVHFNHMHEQQMTDIKKSVDSAALTTALTIGLLHSSNHDFDARN